MSSDNQQTELDEYNTKDKNDEESSNTEDSPDDKDEPTTQKSEFRTGDSLANEYLETVSGADIEESTAKRYEVSLRAFIRYLKSQSTSLSDAKAKDVKNFLREVARNDLAKSTLANRLTAISNVYKYIRLESVSEAEIDMVALGTIDQDDFIAKERVKKDPLSETELKELCDAMNNRRDRLMVLLASEIGARNESLRLLKIDDVDLDDDDPGIQVPNTKSGGEYRIPISDQMALEVERWIKVVRESGTDELGNQYLFPSQRGEKLDHNKSFGLIVDNAAKAAGIQEVVAKREPTKAERRNGVKKDMIEQRRVTPHLLRHTFSLLLEEADLDTEARRDALDHKNIETTKKYYTHNKSDYEDLIRELFHQENTDSD